MSDVLLIFSRYPRLGKVKTRLTPVLSPRQALRLHTAFLLDTLDRTGSLAARRHLFLADCELREARRLAARASEARGLTVGLQTGSDLGDRMWNAYRAATREGEAAVFIGADSPTLPLARIEEAFAALQRESVAIGPAIDGGYYLLGLARPLPRIFQEIDWGTGAVLRQTLERIEGIPRRMLPPWGDVDTPGDLPRLEKELEGPVHPPPKRTARVLRAIRAARRSA